MPPSEVIYFGPLGAAHLPDPIADDRFRWLTKHLASQKGPKKRMVCPWAGQAYRESKFYVGDARHAEPGYTSLAAVVDDLVREYRTFGPFNPANDLPDTLTVLIPDAVEGSVIERVLSTYRPELTPLGLMLGALDPFNRLKSLIGGKGCPYSAPWNFLTIRWMVSGDCVFLNLNPSYKAIYTHIFGRWPLDVTPS